MEKGSIFKYFKGGGGDRERQEELDRFKKRKESQKQYDKTKRKRQAHEDWKKEFEWLEVKEDVMYCQVCRKYSDLSDKSSSLVKGVTSNYRKETLRFHDKSEKHKLCIGKQKTIDNPKETPLAKSFKKAALVNSSVFEALFNTAYYIAKENESFVKYPELLNLMEKNLVSIGTNYRNDKSCKEFCISISEVFRANVQEDLSQTRFFSILTDGSTDRGIREQELVYTRYVDDQGTVKTRLADIVQLQHGHAQGVKDGVLQGLDKVGVDLDTMTQKLVGINTDGASVNLGHKGGAVKLLIDTLNTTLNDGSNCGDYINVVHCVAHNLELAVCDAKKDCQYLNEFERVLKGIFKLYYYSPKKRRELHEIATNLDKELKHYGGIQQIRWVASQYRALKALIDNYEVTVIHLEELSGRKDENADKAKNYLKCMTTERFLTFLHFMLDWTTLLKEVSEEFQGKSCLISDIAVRVEELKQKMSRMKVRRGKHLRRFLEIKEEGKFRNINITQPERRGRQPEDTPAAISNDIDAILSAAEFFLEERFIKHIGGEPHSLYKAFNFQNWVENNEANREEFQRFGQEEIEKLLATFPPRIISNEEKENAAEEWFDLKLYIARNRNQHKTVQSAYESMLKNNDTDHLQNISILVKIMLTISPSTAECERGFSRMNLIKTERRTSMEYESLSSLIRIASDGPSLQDFDPAPAVSHWIESATGSRHIRGHKLPVRRKRARTPDTANSSDSD